MRVGIYVTCAVCNNQKKPRGRSAPVQLYLCEESCPGYEQEPLPGSLWPRETEIEFGFPVAPVGTREE